MKQRGFGLLAYALLVLAVLGAIGGILWWADQNIETSAGKRAGEAAKQAEWDAANEEQRALELKASQDAAAALAAERRKRKVIIQERTVYVDKIVDRPIYRNVCFDAAGLRCANSALLGEPLAVGCKPDGAVPGADGAHRP